ncbi:hypothetical protein ACFXAZ_00180 [Streptomyces sp. NPDC059477]|uniref:hypothetical protein n=1 Tax=Streptomyces sp. NPDC059477 TaxID=3346847 RepID=UPI0036BB929B
MRGGLFGGDPQGDGASDDDPLAVILRPAAGDRLAPPPGRYETIRRGAARRRMLRVAAGAGLACAVAALIALPVYQRTIPDTPRQPTVPLAPPGPTPGTSTPMPSPSASAPPSPAPSGAPPSDPSDMVTPGPSTSTPMPNPTPTEMSTSPAADRAGPSSVPGLGTPSPG